MNKLVVIIANENNESKGVEYFMDSSTFKLNQKQLDIKERARIYGEKWAPYAAQWDLLDDAPMKEVLKDVVDLGLAGITIPKKYGGQDLSAMEYILAVEQANRSMKSYVGGDTIFGTTCTGPSLIMMSDNDDVKDEFLPQIAKGEKTCAIAMTEPNCGSDIASLETTAVPDGEEYVINGQKRFITGAPEFELYATFVRFDHIPGIKGVGGLLVEKGTPGFTLKKGAPAMGIRGATHGELYFNNCRVPKGNLLIGPGKFGRLMSAFNMERLYICAGDLGLAEAAYDAAIEYSNERKQFGRPINEFQSIYHMIAEMYTQIESCRYMMYMAALTAEGGKFPKALEVSIAKLHTSMTTREICWKAVQILGGDGVIMGQFAPERMFRDVSVSLIAGGTTQVLKNVIASLVLGKNLDQRKL